MRIGLVGAVRFELTTPYTPCRCPTWLGHAPTLRSIIHQIAQRKQPAPGNSPPNPGAPNAHTPPPPTVIPAQAGIQNPDGRRRPLTVIPAQAGIQNPGGRRRPHRHSGAGRNPEPRRTRPPPPSFRRRPESRTPVDAGRDGWLFRPGLAVGGVSPSPNPLPLGEGFLLGGGCRFRRSGPGIVMQGRGARPCAPTLYGRQRRIITAPPHKAARRQPSPAGRGLGEGETLYAANPGSNPTVVPYPPPFILRPAQDERRLPYRPPPIRNS